MLSMLSKTEWTKSGSPSDEEVAGEGRSPATDPPSAEREEEEDEDEPPRRRRPDHVPRGSALRLEAALGRRPRLAERQLGLPLPPRPPGSLHRLPPTGRRWPQERPPTCAAGQ
eukprot:TRINITY_DN411_c0_g1_i4.p2 TRINITY_DN411_c0_g1~~TRINITY_DN411_c0_g1_i4.p2  ORF type:complete len:113 (+),score=1.47 TRINITY_DN411_c0_g1_i4:372-710(+)